MKDRVGQDGLEPVFEPSLDLYNFRDVMAAIGLTRIASDVGNGRTAWQQRASGYQFLIIGASEVFSAECEEWVREHASTLDFSGLRNASEVSPERWREHLHQADVLQSQMWAAIGSDGVPHEVGGKRDWNRIAASRLEYAQGAGHVHWLGGITAFLGNGTVNKEAEGKATGGSAPWLSKSTFARFLSGSSAPTLAKSELSALPAGEAQPFKLAQCRWDFACDRDHASRHLAPAKDELLQDQTINALAAVGLASCASAPAKQGLKTPFVTGGNGREVQLCWPIWTVPLRIEGLEAAFALGPASWTNWPKVRGRRRYVEKALVFDRGALEPAENETI